MYQKERLSKLMEIIGQKKIVDIKELERDLFVSRSTLRRDLIVLEKEHKIIRNFGQVELSTNTNIEFGYNVRSNDHECEKRLIASAASNFIGQNQAIFIDSSSTCNALYPYLKNKCLVVVTNGLNLAQLLVEEPSIETFICGGHIKSMSGSILGQSAEKYLENFHADILFLSCSGVDETGVYMASEEQSFIKRKMMELSDQVILLCDSSKIGKKDYFRMCMYDAIDVLITDKELNKRFAATLEDCQVELLVVE